MKKKGCSDGSNVPFAYRCFKGYLSFLFEHVMYKDVNYIGLENVPEEGVPTLIASNHQNALNDALAILMSFKERRVRFIVRADVFSLAPGVNRFLRSIGLLPAFRINHEGEKALQNNAATFRDSEQALAEGNSVTVFPEGGHQTGHWLGEFSFGYTKMAFDAAEMLDFKEDIVLMPACNHYSDYFGIRRKLIVEYGTPVSLKPYYELYKEKPRTAQREVNKIVRGQILGMMLNVRDLSNYDTIEFIRGCSYSSDYARRNGMNPDFLPDKFESDKKLVAELEVATGRDGIKYEIHSASTGWDNVGGKKKKKGISFSEINGDSVPAERPSVYDKADTYRDLLEKAGIKEKVLDSPATVGGIFLKLLRLLLLLPAAVFALWPSFFSWTVPLLFERKMEDKMFQGTLLTAVNALFIFPIFGIITLAVAWSVVGFIPAICWVLLFPALCVFEWKYVHWIKDVLCDIRFMKARKSGLTEEIYNARAAMNEELNNILKNAE